MSDDMPDDYEFIGNVKTLAVNGTLIELLRRIEEDETEKWKIAFTVEEREKCWHVLNGIQRLATKIKSFSNEDKVRQWQSYRAARRS